MEVRIREVIFSTVILCAMIGIGIPVSNSILRKTTNSAMEIASAVKVNDPEKFSYIKRTDVGGFIAEGELIAKDSVSIPDIEGYYFSIRKAEEHYRMHVQTYTTSNGKGGVRVHTRTYWSWDEMKHWTYDADTVQFLGCEFLRKDVRYRPYRRYKETIKEKSNVRFVYETAPVKTYGIIIGKAENKEYANMKFHEGATIEKTVGKAEKNINSAPVVFWVLWLMLTALLITGFYALKNNWLEDNK